MISQITCKQAVRGQFTQGKSYPVDTDYGTHVIVRDDSGSFHHIKKTGEFMAENFRL